MIFEERERERNEGYFKEGYFQGCLNEEQLLQEIKSNKRSFLGFSIENSPLYDDVIDKLQMLTIGLNEPIYDKTDDEGTKISKLIDEFVYIKSAYLNLLCSCDNYLKANSGIKWTNSGRVRRSLIREIYNQANYEYKRLFEKDLFKLVQPYVNISEITFGEILKDLRTELVDITGREDIEKISSNMYSGVAIGDSEDKRFFEPEKFIYAVKNRRRFIQHLICEFSESSEERKTFECVLLFSGNGYLLYGTILNLFKYTDIGCDNFKITLANVEDVLSRLGVQYSIDKKGNITIDGFKLTQGSLSRLFCILRECKRQIDFENTTKASAHISMNARVDIRNVATSRLFAALGEQDLVTKSRLAVLREEGVPDKEGIITAKSTGKSLQVLSKDLRFFAEQAVMGQGIYQIRLSKDVQRKFANLQLGDYIAGQVDRHEWNYFVDYEILDMGGGVVEFYITSIQGINNDLSFGLLNGSEVLNGKNTCLPNFEEYEKLSLPYIDKNFVDILQGPQGLNESTIRYIFGDLLITAEMQALMKRVKFIKQAIAENYNDNQKLDRNGWNQASLDATLASDNYLSRFIKCVRDNLMGSDVLIVSD